MNRQMVRQEPDDSGMMARTMEMNLDQMSGMWARIQRRYYNFQYVYSICRIRSCIPDRPE